jgi:hypothetical protein
MSSPCEFLWVKPTSAGTQAEQKLVVAALRGQLFQTDAATNRPIPAYVTCAMSKQNLPIRIATSATRAEKAKIGDW